MRQTTNNNITMQYPDAVGFAFLPCIIKASGSGVASIEGNHQQGDQDVHVQRGSVCR